MLDNYGAAVVPAHGAIVVQGDDFIYGVSRHGRRPPINGASLKRGPLSISESLRQVLRGPQIVNRGYPGDSIVQGEGRWGWRPGTNLLILSYGFGDQREKTTPELYRQSLTAMIQRAHAAGAAVFLVTTPPLQDGDLNGGLDPYRNIMRDVGAAQGAQVFDTAQEMAKATAPVSQHDSQTPRVYQAVAAAMVPYIELVPMTPTGKRVR